MIQTKLNYFWLLKEPDQTVSGMKSKMLNLKLPYIVNLGKAAILCHSDRANYSTMDQEKYVEDIL